VQQRLRSRSPLPASRITPFSRIATRAKERWTSRAMSLICSSCGISDVGSQWAIPQLRIRIRSAPGPVEGGQIITRALGSSDRTARPPSVLPTRLSRYADGSDPSADWNVDRGVAPIQVDNNRIEQDRRTLKRRGRPMLRLKSVASARVIQSGINTVHCCVNSRLTTPVLNNRRSPSSSGGSPLERVDKRRSLSRLLSGFATKPIGISFLSLMPYLQYRCTRNKMLSPGKRRWNRDNGTAPWITVPRYTAEVVEWF
jgi:hypothetical protein